ncbi:MAG: amidase, partial [Chloroflexi bacterium]|nr:amidase [Chloroflexota bacterium]
AAAERLARAGAEVSETRLPVPMDRLLGVHFFLQNGEGSTVHADLHAQYADFYRPTPRASIEVGLLVPAALYVRALRARRRLTGPMLDLLGSFDGIIAPTAANVAPDPSTTGDPSFQSIWTLFGVPNVSIPTGLSTDRLPYGLQIVGRPFEERALLSTAAWCESIFGHLPVP